MPTRNGKLTRQERREVNRELFRLRARSRPGGKKVFLLETVTEEELLQLAPSRTTNRVLQTAWADFLSQVRGETHFKPIRPWPSSGGVYFVRNRERVKIGVTTDVSARLSALKTSTPDDLRLLAVQEGDRATEQGLHRRFAEFRLSGEWFTLSRDILLYIADLRRVGTGTPASNVCAQEKLVSS